MTDLVYLPFYPVLQLPTNIYFAKWEVSTNTESQQHFFFLAKKVNDKAVLLVKAMTRDTFAFQCF